MECHHAWPPQRGPARPCTLGPWSQDVQPPAIIGSTDWRAKQKKAGSVFLEIQGLTWHWWLHPRAGQGRLWFWEKGGKEHQLEASSSEPCPEPELVLQSWAGRLISGTSVSLFLGKIEGWVQLTPKAISSSDPLELSSQSPSPVQLTRPPSQQQG